jgi:purine-cytosine permease-like protein
MDIGGIILSPIYCIGWIIVGAIAGAIANNIMKSEQPLLWDIILVHRRSDRFAAGAEHT